MLRPHRLCVLCAEALSLDAVLLFEQLCTPLPVLLAPSHHSKVVQTPSDVNVVVAKVLNLDPEG
eukprot:2746034-Rhodomonas_salina.1